MTEIRVEGEGAPLSETHSRENPRGAEPLPPGHALEGEPPPAPVTSDDPEVARTAIEQTRARMSETIDEIEDALTQKKEQIQDRLDVMARVKENPFAATGVALGVGLLFGLLTGGDDEEYEEEYEHHRFEAADGDAEIWRDRAEEWEGRARRLLRIAREQEDELRDLEERYGGLYAHEMDEHGGEHLMEEEGEGALRSTLDDLSDTVSSGITDFVADSIRRMAQSGISQMQGRA